jgi:hypothetical protein
MPARILIRGQVAVRTGDWTRPVAAPVPRNKAGEVLSGQPIAPSSPESPFREGLPFYDKDEDLTYRVIAKINVSEGWGTSSFWIRRWHAPHTLLVKACQMGLLDAAIDPEGVRRYRCRDELRTRAWLLTQRTERYQKQVEQDLRGYAHPVMRMNGSKKGVKRNANRDRF